MAPDNSQQAIAVHRCRLFDFMPKSIQCLASNNSVKGSKNIELAVAREGGTIEIYILNNLGWFVKQIIPCCSEHSVECLLWTNEYGLLSGSLQGCINTYDLNNGCIKISADSFGGAVWSIALSDISNKIAVSCEDGSIKIFSGSSDSLTFIKSLDKQEDRILSVDWHPDETRLVSGSVNAARVWSYKTGHAIMKISIGEDAIVWTVRFLSNGMIATGDSHGMLQFWNSKHGSLVSSHKSHSSDILCMEVTKDERSLFVSGVDPKVVAFKYLGNEDINDNVVSGEWVKGEVIQRHTHDVRALAIAGKYLVSAGVDTNLQCKSIFNFNDRRIHKLKSLPQRSHASYSEDTRNLLLQYDDFLDIWHLPTTITPMGSVGETLRISEMPIRSAQIRLPNNETSNIVSSAISKCGRWVGCSTSTKLRLYKLIFDHGSPHKLMVERVHFVGSQPSTCLQFASNSQYLAALRMDGTLGVIALETQGAHLAHDSQCGKAPRHLLCISPDSKYIAVANTTGGVEIFDVKKLQLTSSLPNSETIVTAMTFKHNSTEIILVNQDRKVSEYDIVSGRCTKYCRENNIYLHMSNRKSQYMPPFVHIMQLNDHKTIFANYDGLCVVNQAERAKHQRSKFINKFEMILSVVKMSSDSILVVEEQPSSITDKLPPSLYQKKFGC